MGTIPRISIVLPHHNIKNQIRMKRQNTDVTLFAFHMSEAHQIYCENNLQKKVPTLFSRKGGLYEQVTFLACDSRYSRRRMKESILIDIFSHKRVMNIEDGMKKDACRNVLLPLLRKTFWIVELPEVGIALRKFVKSPFPSLDIDSCQNSES